jgi:hypothetical protein
MEGEALLGCEVNGQWVEVHRYIFRTWSGLKRLNGKMYYGPSCLLGHGYKGD